MDVTYAIIEVYVTIHNDVIKRNSTDITIWRTSAVKLTALSKNIRSEMKDVQAKEKHIVVVKTSLVLPDSDPRNGFSEYPSHQW